MLVSMFYLETWDEDVIEPNKAIEALSAAAVYLKDGTPEEITLLRKVINNIISTHNDPEFREFCKSFIEHYIEDYDENWA